MSNDRHKYRIWDGEKKAYAHEGYVVTQLGLVGTYDPFVGLIRNINCTVEQCTGLTDKNGKLIYEGDILRFAIQIDVVVTFRNGGFVYSLTEDEKFAYRLTEVIAKETQIIGNIHDDQFRDLTEMVEDSVCD